MKAILLANLGTRDITENGKHLPQARAQGEEIFNRVIAQGTSRHEDVDYPMVRAALEFVLSCGDGLAEIILFATDQPDTDTTKGFRKSDTVYFAKTIQELLKRRELKGASVSVRVVKIEKNPSQLDLMLDFFEGFFKKELRNRDGNLPDTVYVMPVGGAQGTNTAFQLKATNYFRERCQSLYVVDGCAVLLDCGRMILADMRREAALALLEMEDYEGFSRLPLFETRDLAGLRAVAQAQARRANFDFQGARTALQKAFSNVPSADRPFLQELLRELSDTDRAEFLTAELYNNTLSLYRRGAYVDFIGRVFRLSEAVLLQAVEKHAGIPTSKDPALRFKPFEDASRSNPNLDDYLNRYDVTTGAALAEDKAMQRFQKDPAARLKREEPNQANLTAILRFVAEVNLNVDGAPLAGEDVRNRVRDLLSAADRLESLRELRNRTLAGHDFQGVSKELLHARYGRGDILEDLSRLVQLLEIPNAAQSAAVRDWLMARVRSARF